MVSGSKTAEFVVRPSTLFLTYSLEARQVQGGRAPQPDPVLRCFVSILKLHCNCQYLHNQNLSTTISTECGGMSAFPFSTLLGNLREKSSFINASEVIREDILFSRREVFVKWTLGLKSWGQCLP